MLHPETLPLCRAFAQAGVTFWLIGGQAVEVLCADNSGGHVRNHDDIDFLVAAEDGPAALRVLEGLGFGHAHGSLAGGDVFYRRSDLLVDLVPVEQKEQQPPRTLGELAALEWPADLLTLYLVQMDGQQVPTLTPANHVAMKSIVAAFYGAEMRDKDRVDVAVLASL